MVSGYDWLNGGTKEIGLSSLTGKMLCERHNNLLSPLDSEAIRVFNTIEEIRRLQEVRGSLPPEKIWQVKRHRVNARLFERWVGKLLVGLFWVVGKDERWHLTGTSREMPPERVVSDIFGNTSFEAPMGMYLAHAVGDRHSFPDGLSVENCFDPDEDRFVGALIEFRGFRFLFWLTGNPVLSFSTEEGTLFGPEGELPMYHQAAIRFTIRNCLSQVLDLTGNDKWAQLGDAGERKKRAA